MVSLQIIGVRQSIVVRPNQWRSRHPLGRGRARCSISIGLHRSRIGKSLSGKAARWVRYMLYSVLTGVSVNFCHPITAQVQIVARSRRLRRQILMGGPVDSAAGRETVGMSIGTLDYSPHWCYRFGWHLASAWPVAGWRPWLVKNALGGYANRASWLRWACNKCP